MSLAIHMSGTPEELGLVFFGEDFNSSVPCTKMLDKLAELGLPSSENDNEAGENNNQSFGESE